MNARPISLGQRGIEFLLVFYQYKVEVFVPAVKGCGAQDMGWDDARRSQFADFLNHHAGGGWRLHSTEYRPVTVAGGCGKQTGTVLVCIFEKS